MRSKLWQLVASFVLLAVVGSGAVAGTILTGHLESTVVVGVSLPLTLQQPVIQLLPLGRNSFPTLTSDNTSFKVIAAANATDSFLISLPIVNRAVKDITALLNLSHSSGVVLSVTGSGAITNVTGWTYQSWKFTAAAGAHGGNVSVYPFDGVNIEVDVLPWFVGTSVEISGSIGTVTGLEAGTGGVYRAFSPSRYVRYLHNSPSPSTLDTNSQANLPMDMYPGTTSKLYNYDQDRDSSPGRVILGGGAGATEIDLAKYQNWRLTLSQGLTLNNSVTAVLWSATKNFDQAGRGTVTAYLSNLKDSAPFASGTLDLSPWQQGSLTWVERRIKLSIPVGSYTAAAGDTLELKVIVSASSSDMWFAYDTTAYPSRLLLNPKPVANFSANFLSSSNRTAMIALTDLSTSDQGIVSWLWSFGDSTTGTLQNPIHTYGSGATYTVKLTVTEADGDTDTETKTVVVTTTGVTLTKVLPVSAFSASPTLGPPPLKVSFTNLSTSSDPMVSWLWTFGDDGASSQQNPAHIYTSPGTYSVSLTASEADGDSNTKIQTAHILVATPPVPLTVRTNDASNITTTAARLNGTLYSLGTATSANVFFQWGTSSGVYPNQTTPQTMSAPGTFYSDLISPPLTPATVYYFRAVAVGYTTQYGAEESFGTMATITASAGANGSIAPSGSVTVSYGGSQTFTITPSNGYHVADVLVDGSSVNAVTTYTFTNVTANHTITTSFAINTYTITASAGANGSIAPSGSVTVSYGGSQTFTITPSNGYHVADVLVDGSSVNAVTTYTFTNVTANHTIVANFAINTNVYAFQGNGTPSFRRYSISANAWTSLASAPASVAAGGALVYDGADCIYAFLGGNTPSFWRYHISSDSWTWLANAPGNVLDGGSLAYDGVNYIYAFQGSNTASFWRYNIALNSWTSLTPAPGNVKDGGSLAYDGANYVYAFQGSNTASFWRYSIALNSWTSLTPAPGNVKDGGSLAYGGANYIYAFQGNTTASFWRYNIALNSWTSLTPAPGNVKDGGSLAYGGANYIYAFQGNTTASFWRYNITVNSWTAFASAPENVFTGGALASGR